MRSTETATISLSPDLAQEVDRIAAEEHRTRSELFREAFRQYAAQRRRWEAIFATGESIASELGLTAESISTAVKRRRQRRPR